MIYCNTKYIQLYELYNLYINIYNWFSSEMLEQVAHRFTDIHEYLDYLFLKIINVYLYNIGYI